MRIIIKKGNLDSQWVGVDGSYIIDAHKLSISGESGSVTIVDGDKGLQITARDKRLELEPVASNAIILREVDL